MLRPVFDSVEKMKDRLIDRFDGNFFQEYERINRELYTLEESCMYFIEENYKKINDWSPLDITIEGYYNDNKGGEVTYQKIRYVDYNHILQSQNREPYTVRLDETIIQRMLREMDEKDRKDHNPILDIGEVVIDPSDGDLALKINNKWHTMVSGLCVIELADFIETSLSKKM